MLRAQIKTFKIFILLTLSLVLFGQGCTQNSVDLKNVASENSGNGGGYEGKIPLIYHVDNDRISCGDQSIPKTIVLYYSYLDEWFLLENTVADCKNPNRSKISGVITDAVNNRITYNSKTYTPPSGYMVDPTADSDSSDYKTDDGICMNAEGKCSLRAAIEQTAVSTFSKDLNILIPEGQYTISKPMEISGSEFFVSWTKQANHKITISGEGRSKTIISGANQSPILIFKGILYSQIELKGIGFKNGKTKPGYTHVGAVEYGNSLYYTSSHPAEFEPYFTVDDCLFEANAGSFSLLIFSMYSNVVIKNSAFENNLSTGLGFDTQMGTYLVEKSIFKGNSKGLQITPSSAFIKVKDSLIYENKGVGFDFGKCIGCEVENITVYKNDGYGIQMVASGNHYGVASGYPNPENNFIIKNSTIFENGLISGANIDMSNAGPTARTAYFYNSIVARGSSPASNCLWSWNNVEFNHNIVVKNSIFDDVSCGATGDNLINSDPLVVASYDINSQLLGLIPDVLSPALDSGDNLTCSAKDHLGNTRPHDFKGNGAVCDIGSIEKY